jgi:hypothetical protein
LQYDLNILFIVKRLGAGLRGESARHIPRAPTYNGHKTFPWNKSEIWIIKEYRFEGA